MTRQDKKTLNVQTRERIVVFHVSGKRWISTQNQKLKNKI